MSVPMNETCYRCHLRKDLALARELGDEASAKAFEAEMRELMAKMPAHASSPWLAAETARMFEEYYGLNEEDRFRQEKNESNRFALERVEEVRRRVAEAEDPLYAGLQFAILGNYLDFSALQGEVSYETLSGMLDKAQDIQVDTEVYRKLLEDLRQGKKLLYLTDNAGEIVFDRVFAEWIQKLYPQLEITFCVRGGPAHNDATREDAEAVGIPFRVIDNGNRIGGTELGMLSAEAKTAMEEADVILSKGMGNTETLFGCGYNIYYAFLVKCQRFVEFFDKPKMTPLLVRERD